MIYGLLAMAFTLPTVGLCGWYLSRRGVSFKAIWLTLLVLLAATTIGDNLIILSGIVDYDPNKILGLRIGVAPIEDYAYSIASVFVVASVWVGLEKK